MPKIVPIKILKTMKEEYEILKLGNVFVVCKWKQGQNIQLKKSNDKISFIRTEINNNTVWGKEISLYILLGFFLNEVYK